MAERYATQTQAAKASTDACIRQIAGATTTEEFEKLKAKALS